MKKMLKTGVLLCLLLTFTLLFVGCGEQSPSTDSETSPESLLSSSACSSEPVSEEEPSFPDESTEASTESSSGSDCESSAACSSEFPSGAGEASSEGAPSEQASEAAKTSEAPEKPKEELKKEEPQKEEQKKKEPTEYRDGDYTYSIPIDSYRKYIEPSDSEKFLLLTNRANPLPNARKWKPASCFGEELTKVEDALLVKTAAMAMKAMLADAKKRGVYDSYINNGYRDYDLQSYLYENYQKKERSRHPDYSDEEIIALVDTYSAVPGTSEHQTGLAVDFSPVSSKFENTKFYKYLLENAHQFGFILRYEQETIGITGYKAEPWHWRFVGRTAATYIHAHHITLEEYCELIAPGKYKRLPTYQP